MAFSLRMFHWSLKDASLTLEKKLNASLYNSTISVRKLPESAGVTTFSQMRKPFKKRFSKMVWLTLDGRSQ
jgi:hypothetical protein